MALTKSGWLTSPHPIGHAAVRRYAATATSSTVAAAAETPNESQMSNVPVAAHLYHLDGEADPQLGRHVRSLRRNRWWIGGAALVGSLLFGVLSLGQDHQSTAALQIDTEAPELQAVDLSVATLTGSLTGPALTLELSDSALEKAAEQQVGGEISVLVTDTSTPSSVSAAVMVTSSDEQRTTDALAFYESAFDAIVNTSTDQGIDRTLAVLDIRSTSGEERAQQLTNQLVQPGLSDSLVEAFSRELADVQTELRDISDQQDALATLSERSLTSAARSGVDEVGGGVVPFIAGALLGAIVGTLVVLALSFLEWRITDRASIDASISGPVIGIVSTMTPSHLDTLAISLANHAAGRTVVLTPVDDDEATKMATWLEAGLAERGFPGAAVIRPPQAGLDAATATPDVAYILVAAARKSRLRDFSLAGSTLHDAGTGAAGTIVVAETASAYRDAAA